MIVLARESRGWTQKDLAKAIRVVQGTVSKYELGSDPVPEQHAAAICAALNYDPDILEQPGRIVGLGGDFLYRKRARLSSKIQRRVEAEANIRKIQVSRLLRAGVVEEKFPFPTISLEDFSGRPALAAKEARRAFRITRGPISNITQILENAGAIIF